MATAAPSCKAALAEATANWPLRSRLSDGIMGDARHQGVKSDHNEGNAFDLTDDPVHGCDAHWQVEQLMLRKDPRVKYAISRRRIWSDARYAEGWRPYTGSNPHEKHAHVSIKAEARNATGKWWVVVVPAPPSWRLIGSQEVDVTVSDYRVEIATDTAGAGWVRVPVTRSRILGVTPPGLRPAVDGKYLVGQVGFADDDRANDPGTIVSVIEWAPQRTAVVRLSVLN